MRNKAINKGLTLSDVLKKTVVTIVNQQIKQQTIEQADDTINVQKKTLRGFVTSVKATGGIPVSIAVNLDDGQSIFVNPIDDGVLIVPSVGSRVGLTELDAGKFTIIDYGEIQEYRVTVEPSTTGDYEGDITFNAANNININSGEEDGSTVRFNGGGYEGLIIIAELTAKINDLVGEINSIKDTLNSHVHTVATTGTAAAQSGTAAPITSPASPVSSFNKDDYENTSVVHGPKE